MATQNLDLDALKKDLDALKKDVKDLVKSMKDLGEKTVSESKKELLETFSADELKKYADNIKAKSEEGIKTVNKTIKEEPFKSVGIATLLGFVIGWLMRK